MVLGEGHLIESVSNTKKEEEKETGHHDRKESKGCYSFVLCSLSYFVVWADQCTRVA